MADKPLSQITKANTMTNEDLILVSRGINARLISLQVIIQTIIDALNVDMSKLDILVNDGLGDRYLTDNGDYQTLPLADSIGTLAGILKIDGVTIQLNEQGQATVVIPIATTNSLGGIIPDGITTFVDTDGKLSAVGGGTKIDDWTENTAYMPKDLVIYQNILYRCITEHNSGTTFNPINWQRISEEVIPDGSTTQKGVFMIDGNTLFINSNGQLEAAISGGTPISDWQPNTNYTENVSFVIYNNTLYKCILTHTSGDTFNSSEWVALTGPQGADGFSPTINITQTANGYEITIINHDGTSGTYEITNGRDGFSPSVTLDSGNTEDIYKLNITTEQGIIQTPNLKGTTTLQTSKVDKTGTFSASGWVETLIGSDMAYSQIVAMPGITTDLEPRIDVIISSTDISLGIQQNNEFLRITRAVAQTNQITAYCYQEKPTIDLNFHLEVI